MSRVIRWFALPQVMEEDSLVLFTACDTGYLSFAISLIKSADLFSPGATFVLHVINPDESAVIRLQELSNFLQSTRLAISFEEIDLSSLDLDQRRAYFASARFLQISKLLSTFSVPVLSLDADSLLVNPIDQDFTDKKDADIVIVRRDLKQEQPDHLAIATGSIWLSPTSKVSEFLDGISAQIDQGVEARSLEWFVDQKLFYRQMKSYEGSLKVYNLKRKYADWTFSPDSILWAGKGGLKLYDLRFFLLQNLLGDDCSKRNIIHHLVEEFFVTESSPHNDWFLSRLALAVPHRSPMSLKNKYATAAESPVKPSKKNKRAIAFYVPRLDLPWGKKHGEANNFPVISDDIVDLRLHWKEFALRMANQLEHAGISVDILEVPAWEIERDRIDSEDYALAFVPHRCHLNFLSGSTPVLFYMQEFFRWVFVVDHRGWSAASSIYPVSKEVVSSKAATSFNEYRRRLAQGRLSSKFAQQNSKPLERLLEEGLLPSDTRGKWFTRKLLRPYIFLPLQVPTDQSIMMFSDLSELKVVEALVGWAKKNKVCIVMKPHPANMKSMRPFQALVDNEHIHISEANVQDLIQHSVAVYTINSGVGLEAILQVKPVVTFGRVEYDCVTFNASVDLLDDAWEYSRAVSEVVLEERYKGFVDWFLECYAVDMSQPDFGSARMQEIVANVIAITSPLS
ncbi:hypothetical protein ACF8R6_00500 [Pseudomonas sp. CJQ_7]|uniref:capsular polysaccharide export protein, LipB/KpsS family n=1 Tax=Pseudomonas sp. CJQ_7 TaxID=3367166 RepID=UPI00370B5DD1